MSKSIRPKIDAEMLTLSGDGIFFSIQGEGPTIGMPAVFLRLQLCNLSCAWCDTPYTRNEKLPEFWNEWKQLEISEVKAKLMKFPCQRPVITGGEPLLQQAAICKLVAELPKWSIEIETNGTVSVNSELAARCQFNISPKPSNSGISLEKRIRPDLIKSLLNIKNAFFKFVIASISDLEELSILAQQLQIPANRIIVMPEGTEAGKINLALQTLSERSRDLGFRLLPRLHVQIWGNLRGV